MRLDITTHKLLELVRSWKELQHNNPLAMKITPPPHTGRTGQGEFESPSFRAETQSLMCGIPG